MRRMIANWLSCCCTQRLIIEVVLVCCVMTSTAPTGRNHFSPVQEKSPKKRFPFSLEIQTHFENYPEIIEIPFVFQFPAYHIPESEYRVFLHYILKMCVAHLAHPWKFQFLPNYCLIT